VVADDGSGDLLVVDTVVKANFRALGKRFGNRTQVVAAAVAAANAAELALAIAETGSVSIPVDGEQVVLSADELVVTETPTLGWAVASDGGLSVALDLELTEELRRAGMAREAIRFAQETRKTSGLEISDRIEFWWQAADDRLVAALREHEAAIGAEILAVTLTEGRPSADITPHIDAELGLTIWMRVAGG